MHDTVLSHELFELLARKRWTIIGDNFPRKPMSGEDDPELLNGLG